MYKALNKMWLSNITVMASVPDRTFLLSGMRSNLFHKNSRFLRSLCSFAITIVFIISATNFSFSQQITFSKVYNENITPQVLFSAGSNIIVETSDSYLLAGISFAPNSDFIQDFFILETDKLGNLFIWNNFEYPPFRQSVGYYFGSDGVLIDDTNFVFTNINVNHYIYNNVYGGLVKYDRIEERIVWKQMYSELDTLNNVDFEFATSQCRQTNDGGFILCGSRDIGNYNDNNEALILKTNNEGEEMWNVTHSFWEIGLYECAYTINVCNDNGFIVSGASYGYNFYWDAEPFVFKTDSLGNLEWYTYFENYFYRNGAALSCVADDGNYLVAYTETTEQNNSEVTYGILHLLKLDQNGEVIWDKTYGESERDNRVYSLETTTDGSVILCGFSLPTLEWDSDHSWMMKISQDGDRLWHKKYRFPEAESVGTYHWLYHAIQASDGGYIAAGEVFFIDEDNFPNCQHAWVLKTDSLGKAPGLFVSNEDIAKPKYESLLIYPNPTRNRVNINIAKQTEESLLQIYDTKGQKLYERVLPAATENHKIIVSSWAAGAYTTLLKVNDKTVGVGKFVKK